MIDTPDANKIADMYQDDTRFQLCQRIANLNRELAAATERAENAEDGMSHYMAEGWQHKKRAEAAERRAEENARKLTALISVAEKACVNYTKQMPDNDPHKGPLNYLIDAIDAARSEEGK